MFCTPKHFLCRLIDILPKLTDWFYDRNTSVKGVNKYHHEPWKMSKLDDLLGKGRHEELTLFFPMFSFDLSENIRKPLVFWCFQGDQKGILGRKELKNIASIYTFTALFMTTSLQKFVNIPHGFIMLAIWHFMSLWFRWMVERRIVRNETQVQSCSTHLILHTIAFFVQFVSCF